MYLYATCCVLLACRMRSIADTSGAPLLADMAHIFGLLSAGVLRISLRKIRILLGNSIY